MLNRVALVLLGVFASSAVLAQSIDDRVRDLERRVERLESQLLTQAAAPARRQVDGAQDGWKRLENWRSLQRGMTETDVRRVLGEPHRVDAFGSFAVWYYPAGGSDVKFDRDRGVSGWSEPAR